MQITQEQLSAKARQERYIIRRKACQDAMQSAGACLENARKNSYFTCPGEQSLTQASLRTLREVF